MNLSWLKMRMASSVGVYLGETSVAWCVMEKTAFGTRTVAVAEEPCVKQDWAVALDRVLQGVKAQAGVTASVVIGLPASQAFFATLPAGPKKKWPKPSSKRCPTAEK